MSRAFVRFENTFERARLISSPILSLVSVLGIALHFCVFILARLLYVIFRDNYLFITDRFYLKLLSKRSISKIGLSIYWFISISTLFLFFLTDFKFVILFKLIDTDICI